jgi:hypothetical protein
MEGHGDCTIFESKPGARMDAGFSVTYHEYTISIVEADRRFTAVVTRPGALIQHDGHASERWASASCGSFDRALVVAKKAIDGDVIR